MRLGDWENLVAVMTEQEKRLISNKREQEQVEKRYTEARIFYLYGCNGGDLLARKMVDLREERWL